MEGTIDACVPINYATIHIFPILNRYEVSVCCGDIIENLFAGLLEQLLLHLPDLKDLCSNGSFDNFKFKLNIPENLFGAAWFTKATLTRFLHIVASPELLSKTIAIEDEFTQLEEARKFQASLHAQGLQNEFGCKETGDACKWNDKGAIPEPESNIPSSDTSRNELLRAMDLRIIALREELYATFNQAAGALCSLEEISNLARFCDHFGSQNLGYYVRKLLEHSHKCLIVDPLNVSNSSNPCDIRNISEEKADCNILTSKSCTSSVKSVMFGVSPAKVAQVERQSSSGSDLSSHLGDEYQNFDERSKILSRTRNSRRSVSPVTSKSLNYFPCREKAIPQGLVAQNSIVEEGSDIKPESNVPRMTVQDAINLFESKQRDHTNDIQKQKISTDLNITANKSVLRRWSAGMGDLPSNCKSEVSSNDSVHAFSNNPVVASSVEKNAESIFTSTSHDLPGTAEIDVKVDPTSEDPVIQDEVIIKGMKDLDEWNRVKETELKNTMKDMEETNHVHATLVSESRCHRGKKDKKIKGANILKRPEKEVQIRIINATVDPKNNGNAGKEHIPVKKSRKLHKNIPPSSDIQKEASKCATVKRDIPSRRKSLPAPPTSPATGSKIKSQKIRQSQRSIKVEESPERKGNHQSNTLNKNLKNDKKQQAMAVSEKTSNTKILNNCGDYSGMVPADGSFCGKGTKKSSVVPLKSKPYLRKGSGTSPRLVCGVAKAKASQPKDKDMESPKGLENPAKEEFLEPSELVHQTEENNLVGGELESSEVEGVELESESIVNNEEICEEKSIGNEHVVVADDDNGGGEEIQDESVISLSSWVETEEEAPMKNKCCNESAAVDVGGGGSRVRQSLSQMMQEDSEGYVAEWGNAENPPTLVYHKDAPKGLRRLLMFGRKTRGDASPSAISEEDDADDSKLNATRPFFSLSAFKGGKSNYPKFHKVYE